MNRCRSPIRALPTLVASLAAFVAFAGGLPAQEPPAPAPIAPVAAPAAVAPTPWPNDHVLLPALATITVDDLKEWEAWLAADERKGRCAGEPSNDEAAEWIAERFDEFGLEPLGDDGTFLQHFDFRVRGGSGGQKARTQNVVAIWRGSDPALKDEVVVLGAHFDHVGTADSLDAGRIGGPAGSDRIWNGADDNASGTSTLLELAQAFALGSVTCRRSIVFVAFSAEEQGLFGSRWYCEHPAAPLEKTRAMLNMDMVGRNPERPIEMAAIASAKDGMWRKLIADAQGAAPSLVFDLKDGYQPDSDHASFLDFGVPTTFIYTGEHADYHRPTDSPDRLAWDHMEQIGRFAAALAWELANGDEPLVFVKPAFQGGPMPKRLGISASGALTAARMTELGFAPGQGGYEVHEIDPAGVGAKAGLQEGDILLSINGKALASNDTRISLRKILYEVPSGQDVPLVVQRGKEQVTLTAKWD